MRYHEGMIAFRHSANGGLLRRPVLPVPRERLLAIELHAIRPVDLCAEDVEPVGGNAQQPLEFQRIAGSPLLPHAQIKPPREPAPHQFALAKFIQR